MESRVADAVSLEYQPVALIWSDEKPAKALQTAKAQQNLQMAKALQNGENFCRHPAKN